MNKLVLGVIVGAVVVTGVAVWAMRPSEPSTPAPVATTNQAPKASAPADTTRKAVTVKLTATPGKEIFSGGYADAVTYKVGDTYHMLLNRFGSKFSPSEMGYFLLTSPDGGATWKEASKTLFSGIATGRVAKIGDVYRFYHPTQAPTVDGGGESQKIVSAKSSDGKTFTDDPGVRVEPREGYSAEGVTVFQLKDGSYRMYFNENLDSSKERKESEIWGASSADGLAWTRDEVATLVSDSTEGNGGWKQMLHPFVIERPKGGYLMFYNSHSKVFYAYSTDGKTWEKQGQLIADGADVDGYYTDDSTMKLFYGDFDPATGGLIYETTVTES